MKDFSPKGDYYQKKCVSLQRTTKKVVTKKVVIWRIPLNSEQLAANVWQIGMLQPETDDPINAAINHIVITHGLDYERIWMSLNRTSKWILQRLASKAVLQTGEYPTSTIYSALKRLQKDGYVIYSDRYEIEDPFFREWIMRSM